MNNSLFSQYLLPVAIGLIMYNIGLSLVISDFRRIFASPKPLIIGLCCQMIWLPILAFSLAFASDLPPEFQIGLVLIAACPGGATSNLISYLLKGDVALSISLTSINSVLILFSIPGITYLALQLFLDRSALITLPYIQTVLKIFLMILLPVALGMATRIKFPGTARKIEKFMKYITTLLLAVLFLFVIVSSKNTNGSSLQMYLRIAPYVLGLNIAGMVSGYLSGNLAGFNTKRLVTLAVEVGIQNSALAITIASSQVFLGNPTMAVPAVVYGMFTFFNAALFGYIIKKRLRKNVE